MAYADDYNATLAHHYVGADAGAGRHAMHTPAAPSHASSHAAALTRRAPADVRLPCMVYAAVGALCADAGNDTELAIAQMRKTPGVLHVISYEGPRLDNAPACSSGIAVVTRGYWLSRQALARLMAHCGGSVGMFAWNSDAEAAQADARVTRATAQFFDGHLRLWLATTGTERSRTAAARIAGIDEERVDLRVVGQPQSDAGLNVLVAAIALARALQPVPVQVIVAQELEHHPEAPAARENATTMAIPAGLRLISAAGLAA